MTKAARGRLWVGVCGADCIMGLVGKLGRF